MESENHASWFERDGRPLYLVRLDVTTESAVLRWPRPRLARGRGDDHRRARTTRVAWIGHTPFVESAFCAGAAAKLPPCGGRRCRAGTRRATGARVRHVTRVRRAAPGRNRARRKCKVGH